MPTYSPLFLHLADQQLADTLYLSTTIVAYTLENVNAHISIYPQKPAPIDSNSHQFPANFRFGVTPQQPQYHR